MRATGIVRRIDDLGRIVIPKEIRKRLQAGEGTPMEIFVDGDTVCLQKYEVTENYLDAVNHLRQGILCDADIGNRAEVLEKLDEVIATLGGGENGDV